MKQITLLLGSLLICTYTFAYIPGDHDSHLLNSLNSALKEKQSIPPHQNDLNISYGGADISRRPTIVPHITTV